MGDFQSNALRDALANHGQRIRNIERFAASGVMLSWLPQISLGGGGQAIFDDAGVLGWWVRVNELFTVYWEWTLIGYTRTVGDTLQVGNFPNTDMTGATQLAGGWTAKQTGTNLLCSGHWQEYQQGIYGFRSTELRPCYQNGAPTGARVYLSDSQPWVLANGDFLTGWSIWKAPIDGY